MSHRSLNPQHKGPTLTEFAYVSYVNQCLRQIPLELFLYGSFNPEDSQC